MFHGKNDGFLWISPPIQIPSGPSFNGCQVQATPFGQDLGTSVVPAPQPRSRTDPKAFLPSLSKKQKGRNYFRSQAAQDGVQTLERKHSFWMGFSNFEEGFSDIFDCFFPHFTITHAIFGTFLTHPVVPGTCFFTTGPLLPTTK